MKTKYALMSRMLWVNLTVEEGRSVFSRKCREAMGGGFVRGGFIPMADP